MQAENLRQLKNENDDIGSHAYSTSLYVVHHYRASQCSQFVCLKRRIEPSRTRCVRLSVICTAIPDIKLRAETKVCCTIEKWCNFNRFNIILNGDILLNLIRKMKYLTDQI